MYQDIKNFFLKIFSGNLTQNQKIFTTISLAWIILIGYLTWWNGLKSFAVDKYKNCTINYPKGIYK